MNETFNPFDAYESKPGGPEETDEETIKRAFLELPSEEVELLANNLARPDGFIKSLIFGRLITSRELGRKFDGPFARTHRGYYLSSPRDESFGENDYLSFKVGTTQRMYTESHMNSVDKPFVGGLGYVFPAQELLDRPDSRVSWGNLNVWESLRRLQDTPQMEPRFELVAQYGEAKLHQDEFRPDKKDFLTKVHIARKANTLVVGDQAEVNIDPTGENLPTLALDQTIILIPQASRDAFLRLVRMKIKEMARWKETLAQEYQIDIENLTAEAVVSRYQNIYWYPQRNIELAVEYLSTNRERISALRANK